MRAVEDTGCGSANLIQIRRAKEPAPANDEVTHGGCRVTKFGAVCAFLRNGACSKTLMYVLDRGLGHPMDLEESATEPLAGGLMQGYQCGMLWGSTLAAGAQAYRLHGASPRAEAAAMSAAQGLVETFRVRHQTIDCLDITDTNPQDKWQVFMHFFVKGGTIGCARRIADYAPAAAEAIRAAFSEDRREASCCPSNCAATLARKMGASQMHVVMAAGFAGGIGLSGGACGALGAAIWILGVRGREEGASKKVIESRIGEATERFLKSSGYEFECAQIVGRRFEGIDDHARHVRDGGCSEIIDALAAVGDGDPSRPDAYFGGDEKAPHTMNISVRDVSVD